MLRAVLSVIAGYLAMSAIVFVTLTLAYVMLGAAGSFKGSSYDVSGTWVAIMFVVGLIAGIIGGVLCAVIAQRTTAPMALAALVFVLGMVMAVPVLTSEKVQPTTRPAEVGPMDAMQNANQPAMIALAHPFIGAIGVLIGARLVRKPSTAIDEQVNR